jgi:hypothetical protein
MSTFSVEKCPVSSNIYKITNEAYVFDVEFYFSKNLLFTLNKEEKENECDMSKELQKANSSVDHYYKIEKTGSEFTKVLSLFDPYKSLRFLISRDFHAQNVTATWTKMWEILNSLDIVPQTMKNESYVTFETSEVLGDSFQALYHYVKTKTSIKSHVWSINAPESSQDVFMFEQYYKSRTSRCELEKVKEVLLEQGIEKVHLFVGNRSVECSDYNKLEEAHINQLIQEVELCNLCLKKGGCAIFKAYTMFTDETKSVITMLYEVFETVFIFKPKTSKLSTSECFIIGKNYKGANNRIVDSGIALPSSCVLGRLQVDIIEKARELYDTILSVKTPEDDKFWKTLKGLYKPQYINLQKEWFRRFPIKTLRPKDRLKIRDTMANAFTN